MNSQSKEDNIIDALHKNIYEKNDVETLKTLSLLTRESQESENMILVLMNIFMRCTKSAETKKEGFIKEIIFEKEVSTLFSVLFLAIFEGPYSITLDTLTVLLIANDHDLYDPLRHRFVHKLNQIDKVNIDTKFKFLEEQFFSILK